MFKKTSMFSLSKLNAQVFKEKIKNNKIEQLKQESISSKKQFYYKLIIEVIKFIFQLYIDQK
jgi:hypothetical protein